MVSQFKAWFRRRGGLWQHPDFLKLWAAQSTSAFGAQIAGVAVPLLAAVTLDATALEMGILTAVGSLPFLLIGLTRTNEVIEEERPPCTFGVKSSGLAYSAICLLSEVFRKSLRCCERRYLCDATWQILTASFPGLTI